jgi:hypothetical protein
MSVCACRGDLSCVASAKKEALQSEDGSVAISKSGPLLTELSKFYSISADFDGIILTGKRAV